MIDAIKSAKISIDDRAISRRLDLLKKSDEEILVEDFGAGSKRLKSSLRKVAKMVKIVSVKPKYGKAYANIINSFGYQHIVELGTAFGIGTSYLAMPGEKVITVEGSAAMSNIANETFRYLKLTNIELIEGQFDDCLNDTISGETRPDFIYIDGNHTYDSTMHYFNFFKTHAAENACLVFDDINWSKGMLKAWQEIASLSEFSINLLRVGIILQGDFETREHLTLKI